MEECTLEEWVAKLIPEHRARLEYDALQARLSVAEKARDDEVRRAVAEATAQSAETIAELREECERLREGHCKDCCCARAWKALGITGYTGKGIPEEIAAHVEAAVWRAIRDVAEPALNALCEPPHDVDHAKDILRGWLLRARAEDEGGGK